MIIQFTATYTPHTPKTETCYAANFVVTGVKGDCHNITKTPDVTINNQIGIIQILGFQWKAQLTPSYT